MALTDKQIQDFQAQLGNIKTQALQVQEGVKNLPQNGGGSSSPPPANQGGGTQGGTTTQTGDGTLTGEVVRRLLNQSGAISSQDTRLEDRLNQAMGRIEAGTEASRERIESQFDRQVTRARETGEDKLDATREAQRGFARNNAALRQIRDETQNTVKDLRQRQEELILANQSQAAQQLADLEIQAIEFEQQAQQRVYENLLGLGQLGLQQDQLRIQEERETRLSQQMQFQQDQAKANIALEFGVNLQEGDSFEDVIARAKPNASERQRLELEKLEAQIAESRASVQKLRQGDELNETDVESVSTAIINNPQLRDALLGEAPDLDTMSRILNRAKEKEEQQLRAEFSRRMLNEDATAKQLAEGIRSGETQLSVLSQADGISIAQELRGFGRKQLSDEAEKSEPSTYQQLIGGAAALSLQPGAATTDFFFGQGTGILGTGAEPEVGESFRQGRPVFSGQ